MKKYIPSKSYDFLKETKDHFLQRLQKESRKRQFIFVKIKNKKYIISFGADGFITTSYGRFKLIQAKILFGKWGWHYILIYPNIEELIERKKIFLNLRSGCYSGIALGDMICDCRKKLKIAQRNCVKNRGGIVIEVPAHDGRGHQQTKMTEKRLIDELGVSATEAANLFHGKDYLTDIRSFDEAAIILKALGFKNNLFEISTNNLKKIKDLMEVGINLSCKSILVKNNRELKLIKKI